MIRWCAYCQAFLGESEPLDSAEITHGMCHECALRLEAHDELVDQTAAVRALMNRIFACAAAADDSAIPALIAEAHAAHLPPASILVGLLQPALYRAGQAWQDGMMSVAAEHRFTAWCDRFFAQLGASAPPPAAPLDLLMFLAPGNRHTMGPRFLVELLAARGFVAQHAQPVASIADAAHEIERLRPRVVGISCALPSALPKADAMVLELAARVDPSWPRRFLIGGFAVRAQGRPWVSAAGAEIAPTIEDVERVIGAR
ncbi:MAG: cobalamin B12-binding domain-containing protein [Deltaproteobacteria bacterium]|nr:cobalamin B12-binding domain-containing protein [Deltaproteobacteria bacterium]